LTDASSPQFLASLWDRQDNRGRHVGGADEGELVDANLDASDEGEEEDRENSPDER
jgi:DNA ligase-1